MVRQRDSGQIFAMKMLHKWEMLKRAEVSVASGGTLGGYRPPRPAGEAGAWLLNRKRSHPQQRVFFLSLPHNKPFLEQAELFPFSSFFF